MKIGAAEYIAVATIAGLLFITFASGQEPDEAKKKDNSQDKASGRRVAKAGTRRVATQALAEQTESLLAWQNLAAFLDLIAFRESRWNSGLGAKKVGTNGAIGLYQLRPTSAFTLREFNWTKPEAIAHGAALLDPRINTAAIVRYIASVNGKGSSKLGATWLDIAVAMAYPIFVRGRPTATMYAKLPPDGKLRTRFPTLAKFQKRYDDAVFRAHHARAKVGLDPGFLESPSGPPGWGGAWRATFRRNGVRNLSAMLGGDATLLL